VIWIISTADPSHLGHLPPSQLPPGANHIMSHRFITEKPAAVSQTKAILQADRVPMMSPHLSLAISDLYAHTIATGKITQSHRRVLMEAICTACLGEEERSAIDRVLWATVRGRLEMVED
jgi:hypothetical protein